MMAGDPLCFSAINSPCKRQLTSSDFLGGGGDADNSAINPPCKRQITFFDFLGGGNNKKSSEDQSEREEENCGDVSMELKLGLGDVSMAPAKQTAVKRENSSNSEQKEDEDDRDRDCSTRRLTLEVGDHRWSIKKKLTKSDVSATCRLMLASRDARENVLSFWDPPRVEQVGTGGGAAVRVLDCDKRTEHELKLKKHKSSRSFVLNDGWSREFVKKHELKKGDTIGLFWDQTRDRLGFGVLSRASRN